VAAERARAFRRVFPAAEFESEPAEIVGDEVSREDALLLMVQGWMLHSGPVRASALAETLGLPAAEVGQALLRLETTGAVLRGTFTSEPRGLKPLPIAATNGAAEAAPLQNDRAQARSPVPHEFATTVETQHAASLHVEAREIEWCERRLLARIHRLTVGRLRKQIEPVTAAEYMRWLLRWQHVAPCAQATGERGLLEVVQQLQGFEIPANAWEREVLARRVHGYDPAALDQLCLTGAVGWGRLSPHPATLEKSAGARRVIPTSVAPITFFVRGDSDWMMPRHEDPEEARGLSAGARAVAEFLRQRGASFFADIVRGTERLKSEVETALWELVAAGLVTADGFDNLRALLDPKRRAGQGHGKSSRPRHSAGRWSLLYAGGAAERHKAVEAACWVLLRRYGVVFRELLARESLAVPWRELLFAFRRLEDRGEIRGGRFITGFAGEQFALPAAVESLRATRRMPLTGEVVRLSAADPLNLVGVILPGERVAAISGRYVTFRDGVPVDDDVRPSAVAGD
jgi:ATP-dependent Lhr-like helicase